MRFATIVTLLAATLAFAPAARAQQVEPEVFTLPNGMKFLLVPRHDQPNTVAAGWLAKVGSVNERPGITGISHFFEHMMFRAPTPSAPATPPAMPTTALARRRSATRSTNSLGVHSTTATSREASPMHGTPRTTRRNWRVCAQS